MKISKTFGLFDLYKQSKCELDCAYSYFLKSGNILFRMYNKSQCFNVKDKEDTINLGKNTYIWNRKKKNMKIEPN